MMPIVSWRRGVCAGATVLSALTGRVTSAATMGRFMGAMDALVVVVVAGGAAAACTCGCAALCDAVDSVHPAGGSHGVAGAVGADGDDASDELVIAFEPRALEPALGVVVFFAEVARFVWVGEASTDGPMKKPINRKLTATCRRCMVRTVCYKTHAGAEPWLECSDVLNCEGCSSPCPDVMGVMDPDHPWFS